MQAPRGAEQQPGPIPFAAHHRFEREECEHIGEPLGFDAADHPFAGHVRIFIEHHEQFGRQNRQPSPRHHRPTQPPPGPSEQPPSQEPPDPSHLRQRQKPRQPAECPIENLVGVGRIDEEIVLAPLGVPVVLGLREIMGLIDIGHRPRAMQKEHSENEQHLDDRPPPRRSRRPTLRQCRFGGQAGHPASSAIARLIRAIQRRGTARRLSIKRYNSVCTTASREDGWPWNDARKERRIG